MNIEKIESALKLHVNYKGISSNGKYLREMDKLTYIYNYKGARGLALSNMLNDYYKIVGVSNLDQALKRLREKEGIIFSKLLKKGYKTRKGLRIALKIYSKKHLDKNCIELKREERSKQVTSWCLWALEYAAKEETDLYDKLINKSYK